MTLNTPFIFLFEIAREHLWHVTCHHEGLFIAVDMGNKWLRFVVSYLAIL